MLEKERSPGGYASDSETSSTGGYRSSVYIVRTNGNGSGIDDRKKVCGGKSGGYTSDSTEASTEVNVIDAPKKVCRKKEERSYLEHYLVFIQPVTILDLRDDSGLSDNLHLGSDKSSTGCSRGRCLGSKVRTVPSLLMHIASQCQ